MDDTNDIFGIPSDLAAQSFKKGSLLQSQGEKSSSAFFVKKGLLRSYTIDHKGKEHVFMFAPENWIISDIESQEFDQPTALFIECLEDSELFVFDKNHLGSIQLSNEQYERLINMLSRRIGVLQRRMIGMMSSTAQERYEEFLRNYPNLINRVPQRMIASYLGVTPEALSKIRGKIAKSR